MTINLADNTPRIEYSVAQGVVQTVFAVPFEFFDNGDLTVYVDGVQKYEGSDFSISGGDGSTGSITFNTAVPPEVQQVTGAVGGSTVVIVRDIAIERTTDFTSNAINRAALNTQLDTIIGMIADLDDKASRTLQISDYEIAPTLSLPSIEDRAGRVIAFDENGNTIAGPTADEVINGEEYATQSAASAAAAALSATAAATSETNAETAETAAAASAAAALISETAAAASESAAATSETNAATSATAAASSAASAASSATDAATSETNAASSATAAAASASAAATSATNAATSETNAATSATAAAASQVAAAASAASAANSYDLFDDRYLGSKTSDPTLDNDGNALVAGALYFNSTANEMRVYDGGGWIAASSAGGASLLNYNYTATAGQTTFSGADDNAATLSYTQQNLIVTLNGIVLEDGTDYTASNGTSIVLTTAAAAGDELNIVAFKSFTVADTYSIAQADATFATAAQGALADTAVQPNDDVTLGTITSGNITNVSTVRVSSSNGVRLYDDVDGGIVVASSRVYPSDQTGAVNDATISIGQASYRFKDLYLSGTAYAGTAVGIGTTSLSISPLHISKTGADTNVLLQADNTRNSQVLFGDTDDVDVGKIGYNHSSNYMAFTVNASERLRIDASGRLLVGTMSAGGLGGITLYPGAEQRFNRSSDGYNIAFFRNGTQVGGIYNRGSSTTYYTTSDYRLKEDVQPMTDASSRVLALNPVNFAWKVDGTRVDGFLAHEAQAVVPEAVHGTKDAMRTEEYEATPAVLDDEGNVVTEAVMGTREVPDYQGIDQSKLVPLLTAALQEALGRIETLEADVAALKGATNV